MPEERNVTLILNCVVKGYHACDLGFRSWWGVVVRSKRGERGNTFNLVNQGGQLGHLQAELAAPLWPLNADDNQ